MTLPVSRKPGGTPDHGTPDDLRAHIRAAELIDALQAHALDPESKMTSTQVSAALALLKKALPDLPQAGGEGGAQRLAHEDWLDLLD